MQQKTAEKIRKTVQVVHTQKSEKTELVCYSI